MDNIKDTLIKKTKAALEKTNDAKHDWFVQTVVPVLYNAADRGHKDFTFCGDSPIPGIAKIFSELYNNTMYYDEMCSRLGLVYSSKLSMFSNNRCRITSITISWM